MPNRFERRRAARTILGVLTVIAAVWATSPSWAQRGSGSDDTGARTVAARDTIPVRRRWDPSRDRDMSSLYQRAREQFIATWGFAPGQQAQPVPGSFPITSWTPIGPDRINEIAIPESFMNASGRINSIAIHPTAGNTIYVGAADGGIWKTIDGGFWFPLTDGQCSLEIGAVAIDPVSPNIVYAGTGDPFLGGAMVHDEPGGCGLLRSTDNGTTWTVIAGITGANSFGTRVEKLVIDPVTAGSTTTTTILADTGDKGLLRSTDSGATWTQVLAGKVTDVAIDPSHAQTVYAAIGNTSGNNNGIFKSTDGGATFPTKLDSGFPSSGVGVIKFDIARSSPSTLYAAVENPANHSLLGIFRTTNSGTLWSQVAASGASGGRQLGYDLTLNVDPTNASTVYFGATSLFKSTDAGATFTTLSNTLGPIHVDFHAFAFQPGNASTIYVGNDGGIYKSTDRGSTWSSLNSNLAITQIYPGGALHPSNPNIILAGTQDNGTIKYSGFATWDGLRSSPSGRFLCGDGGFTAIDQSAPTTYYAACFGQQAAFDGPAVFRSDDAGSTWTAKNNGFNPNDPAAESPLVMSPSNSQTLYYGTDKVYKTIDRGESWTPSGTAFQGVNVRAIAPAASNPNIIYIIASLAPTGLFKSTDGNASYAPVDSSSLPGGISPNSLAVHPTDPNTVFLGYGTTFSFIPGVLKTTDGGATWTDITGNLPANLAINAIALDPSAPTRKILVATHLGVFGTINGGITWTPNGVNLPNVVVTDLKYNPATAELIAFTFGRGAFKASLSQTATHDFNGDGNSDIAWRQDTGTAAAWLMNGGHLVQAGIFGTVSNSWQIVGQRDFDGDGKHDWLWRESSGTVAMWFLDGLQLLSVRGVANVSTNWVIAGTGDFNGDFKGDILWRESSNGSVVIWLMDSFHVLQSVSLGAVSTNWVIVGTGDFDGNGARDILWRDSSTGTVAIWFLDNRQRILQVGNLGAVPANWVIVGTGDFDGDGISDILWRDTKTDAVVIWFMNGPQNPQIGTVGKVESEFVVAETGDFDGNGKSDLLWRNTKTGAVAIWFMNGLQATAVSLGAVTLDWTIQGLNAD